MVSLNRSTCAFIYVSGGASGAAIFHAPGFIVQFWSVVNDREFGQRSRGVIAKTVQRDEPDLPRGYGFSEIN